MSNDEMNDKINALAFLFFFESLVFSVVLIALASGVL